jgi:hypothetical protein
VTSRRSTWQRRASSDAKRPQLLVFAEGDQTEPIYLTHWYRLFRERIIIKVAPHLHTAPLQLVQAAIAQRSIDLREARRRRGDAYDGYWCIFDVDVHPRVPEALRLAAENGICVALSNPCIELWFILHFQSQTAYLNRDEAQRRSRDLLGAGKVLTPKALELLVEGYEAAKGRAQNLDRKHEGDGSPPHSNPSSSVWSIIDIIRG